MRGTSIRKKIANSLLVVILLSGLMSLSTNDPQRINFVLRLASNVIYPFQVAVHSVGNFFVNSWNFVGDVRRVYSENIRLQEELEQYEGIALRINELRLANARLRDLLDFQQQLDYQVTAAEVIGRSPSTWYSTVTINKGSRHGIDLNMPVVNSQGLVGRVVEVYPGYSKVQLLISPDSGTSAIVQRTRDNGVLVGLHTPIGYTRLTHLPPDSDIEVGDVVISSSLTGIYPKGLQIGRVVEVSYDPVKMETSALIMPEVDFERLEEVLIITDFQPEDD